MTQSGHTDDSTPVIMSISGHDPSGSSGIQADIETCLSLGCHCTPIIACISARDTRELKEFVPVDAPLLIQQARALLEDMPIKAIKIGFLGSIENIEAVHSILSDYPDIPVVLDPVCNIGSDDLHYAETLQSALKTLLIPDATLVTPDLVEAYELAQQGDTLDACASEIIEGGCEQVLITGSKRGKDAIENSLYGKQGLIKRFSWPRLNVFSHGAGATLSAAIAAYLAHGLRLTEAIEQGQDFTFQALEHSCRLGMGTQTPNRLYWASSNYKNNKRGCC